MKDTFKDSKLKPKGKNILPRLKIWLLQGKSITQLEALKLFNTTRLAVYIFRLRDQYKLPIHTEIIRSNGDQFASYSLVTKKKKQKFN
jgi:hypothetical protein